MQATPCLPACLQYLRNHPETLRELTEHLGTTSVAEVVVLIAGADDITAGYLGPSQLAWLSESQLMDLILEQLLTAEAADAQRNAAAVLAAIARSQSSPLLANFRDSDLLAKLFRQACCRARHLTLLPPAAAPRRDSPVEPVPRRLQVFCMQSCPMCCCRHAFASSGTVSSQALDVCIALLEPKMPPPNSQQSPAHGDHQVEPEIDPAVEAADQQLKALCVKVRTGAGRPPFPGHLQPQRPQAPAIAVEGRRRNQGPLLGQAAFEGRHAF